MIHFLKQLVPQWMKNVFYHLPLAFLAAVYFGMPGKKLRVIGITGTNGKTTTTQFVTKILRQAGKKVAMASTINFSIGDEEWVNASKLTTMSAWNLQKFLRHAVDAGCEFAVVETSSHSIDQYRIFGISYEVAVMTNVTREHLDYHKTMEEYRRVKRFLFDRAKMAVVNFDMERPDEYLEANDFEKKISYSTEHPQADICAKDIVETLGGSVFSLDGVRYEIALPGRYNIENAMAAIGVGMLFSVSGEAMREALLLLASVPGRMEMIPNNRGLHVFVDYAVTPDSLEKLYQLALKMKSGTSKIIAVFGACGDRDRGKRPIMGRIVSRYADVVILTNEDPYYEDPNRIIEEIAVGIEGKKEGDDFFKIFDRREALVKALSLAQAGDIVLVTGKGAEETMKIGDQMIPWNDRNVIEDVLKD